MNHPGEEHQQAKQDVDEKVLADTAFHRDGDRWQKNGEQDQDQLVHGFWAPRIRKTALTLYRPISSTERAPENKARLTRSVRTMPRRAKTQLGTSSILGTPTSLLVVSHLPLTTAIKRMTHRMRRSTIATGEELRARACRHSHRRVISDGE
jgi:hypothetical protein